MERRQPHDYPRRILAIVTGLHPQIVTETLYTLATDKTAPFLPTDIHIITTRAGAEVCREAFLGNTPEQQQLKRLCEDYQLPDIPLTDEHIHITNPLESTFTNHSDAVLHNKLSSDFVARLMFRLTSDPESALHLSIAGGRKTLSFYAGYALSLYGRLQDRLSHTLINTPYQRNPSFYYPPPEPIDIVYNDARYSTKDALIILSDIPFVRMRYQVPEELLNGNASFNEAIDLIQQFAHPQSVMLHVQHHKIILNGMAITLEHSQFALYYWMCIRAIDKEPTLILNADAFLPDFLAVYGEVVGEGSGHYARVESLSDKGDLAKQRQWFLSTKSKLKKSLENVLGEKAAEAFLIQTIVTDGATGYAVSIDPSIISLNAETPQKSP